MKASTHVHFLHQKKRPVMFRRISVYLLLSGCLFFATFFALHLADQSMRGTPFQNSSSQPVTITGQAVALRVDSGNKASLPGSYHYADGRILLDLQPKPGQKVQVLVSRLSGNPVFFRQWEVVQPNFREEINLAYLPEGMYLIDIQSGQENMSQMLIK
jgi:hypothetical protein